jgi:hypothetical protein
LIRFLSVQGSGIREDDSHDTEPNRFKSSPIFSLWVCRKVRLRSTKLLGTALGGGCDVWLTISLLLLLLLLLLSLLLL